jgi:SAM-dependent methyltransferase
VTVREFARLQREHGWQPNIVAGDCPLLWIAERAEIDQSSFSGDQLGSLETGADGWWYRTRNMVLDDALATCGISSALWDVGSGAGAVAAYLHRNGREVVAVEPGAGGASVSAQRGVASIQGTLDALALPSQSLSAIGMFDVLEHLPNRPAMLHEIRRVLAPGGHLILTLPALRMLWSGSDEAAGHYLRYSKRTIRRELADAGFTVERARYFFVLTVLPLLILRAIPHRLGRGPVVTDEELVAKGVGRIGRIASWCERMWARVGLTGSSLLVVARAN